MAAIIILTIIAAVLVALFAMVYMVANKVFDVAVKSSVSKERVLDTNAGDSDGADRSAELRNRVWLKGQQFKERYLTTPDRQRLFGRILPAPAPSGNWAVICHGYTGNGLKMGSAARHFHEAGYHVLLPDLRGCGNSTGDYLGMGWLDSQDILLWLDTILEQDSGAQIVLTGGSMGGATVMMTTGLPLPPNVVAAIEDCGYTSVWDVFTYQLKKVFGLSQFPFMYLADSMAKRRAGYSFREASSIDRLGKSKTPTLFIHGTADGFVPFHMLEENYEAAACPKQKLVVEGAGHGVSADVAPELYWRTVDEFLSQYIK